MYNYGPVLKSYHTGQHVFSWKHVTERILVDLENQSTRVYYVLLVYIR
jgi:hypothetical protein